MRYLIALVAAAGLLIQPFRLVFPVGSSMEPTYRSFQPLLMTPFKGEVKKGDVIVFRSPEGTSIKRVYAVGGESFWVMEHPEEVTEHKMIEPISEEGMKLISTSPVMLAKPVRYTVPHGYLFVKGDNDGTSIDSRFYGPIKIGSVIGVVK